MQIELFAGVVQLLIVGCKEEQSSGQAYALHLIVVCIDQLQSGIGPLAQGSCRVEFFLQGLQIGFNARQVQHVATHALAYCRQHGIAYPVYLAGLVPQAVYHQQAVGKAYLGVSLQKGSGPQQTDNFLPTTVGHVECYIGR